MGTTGSKRLVKGLPVIAAVCLTTALALGQDQATPASQLEWVVTKWQSAPFWHLESRPAANGRWDVRPALDRPRDATGLAFLKTLRASATSGRVGFFALNRSAANGASSPLRTGSWTGRARSLLSHPLNSAAAGPLTFTCPSGGTCWVGGASGVWSASGNWSNGVPTSSTNALIDNNNANGQGASAVTLDIGGAKANNLTVDSDDSLTFSNNTNLTVSGSSISNAGHVTLNNNTSLTMNGSSISNAGQITLNSTGNSTELIIGNSAVTLSGGGTLTMSNNASNIILGNATGDTLTNQETIQGSGNIGDGRMTLVNSGTINANQPTPLTIQANGGVTNTGTLEATNGILALNGISNITNTGGTILASNGSTLQAINATITAGR